MCEDTCCISHYLAGIFNVDFPTNKSVHTMNEGNIAFNDTFNTFYLWLFDARHMVKDHSDSERGNPLPQNHFD